MIKNNFKNLPIQRPLWTLPISVSLLHKLKDAGYEYFEDVLCKNKQDELTNLLGDAKNEFQILNKVPLYKTAVELYNEENIENGNIVSFSKAVDDLLDGGIPTSKITELIGAPGSGKTQICLQLCVSVQIPECLGGLYGSAVYIETNSNFSTKRINEMYAACLAHCVKISAQSDLSSHEQREVQNMVDNNPFNNIIKFSISGIEELRASIFSIQNMLECSRKEIKLIIIDSFTFPCYLNEITVERTKMISIIMNHLYQLASIHHLAVVVTNELTTCVLNNENEKIIPSLGESFAHTIHNRILLSQKIQSNSYTALLNKSSEFPSNSSCFQITKDGIRDIPVN